MTIFTNASLDFNAMDFTKWQTINGDYLALEQARTEYIEKCLEQIYYYMERYPTHINYPIWREYATRIEYILALRN